MNNDYSYTFINRYNAAISPSTVHIKNTGLARFFKRYLLQEAQSVFEFKLPDAWDHNYFLSVLYIVGFVSVVDIPGYGVLPQHCTLGGRTVQYQPFFTKVANPVSRTFKRYTIGVNTELIKLENDFCGLYDIVDYYGDLMALCAETLGVNILNSKLSFVFSAGGKADAESYKKLYDQVASGNPMAVADKHLFNDDGTLAVQLFTQNVGQNFIGDKLVDTLRNIRNMFLTDIGIPNVNLAKQSGVTDSEVAANDLEVKAKVSIWFDNITRSMEKVRDMFGIPEDQLNVKWRGEESYGMDVNSGTVQSGSNDI